MKTLTKIMIVLTILIISPFVYMLSILLPQLNGVPNLNYLPIISLVLHIIGIGVLALILAWIIPKVVRKYQYKKRFEI